MIEAIAEKMEWKLDLYAKVAPHLKAGGDLRLNTSGLSIEALATGMPADRRSQFRVASTFNPPRYMPLVELIPIAATDAALLDGLEAWLTTHLGRASCVPRTRPTSSPTASACSSILAVLHHTARLGLAFDEVDLLTGPRIGRPKSATFRTADVVGLDTLVHVLGTMQATLPDDPWCAYFRDARSGCRR